METPAGARRTMLDALTLGNPLRCAVVVHSTVVPAGGMLTFHAQGFQPHATIRVQLADDGTTLAHFCLDAHGATTGLTRVPIPHSAGPATRLLAFDDGSTRFDLLVTVAPSRAVVHVAPREAMPGAPVFFDGSGFPPGGVLNVKFHHDGEPHEFPIDRNGTVSGRYELPCGAEYGEQDLIFLAANPATMARAAITIL